MNFIQHALIHEKASIDLMGLVNLNKATLYKRVCPSVGQKDRTITRKNRQDSFYLGLLLAFDTNADGQTDQRTELRTYQWTD